MGPRFCKRGNQAWAVVVCKDNDKLQWGHAFVSVETEDLEVAGGPEDVLQWGHAFVSVETSLWARGQPVGRASMGPRFCKRGNPAFLFLATPISGASMGPRFCKRGNAL